MRSALLVFASLLACRPPAGTDANPEPAPVVESATVAFEHVPTEGRTLLPGLIDAHTHVQMPKQLERALAFGVTTEIDMFTTDEVAAGLRGPATNRAELVSASVLATAPGGHGTEYGITIPTVSKGSMQGLIHARQLGFMPAMTSVRLEGAWTEHALDIRDLVAEP
ncbi:MAG: hypothetical protein AAF799_36800 [Myxococcota bacterium]